MIYDELTFTHMPTCMTCMYVLTAFGLVLFVLVDEQESGALWAERQQDALYHSRDEEESQEERPQVLVSHDHFQSKYLKPTQTLMNCLHSS